MRGTLILVALVVIASVGVVPQPVVADDEWPDRCADAEYIDNGTYSGEISPDDWDTFLLDLDKGESINARLEWETNTRQLSIDHTDEENYNNPSSELHETYASASFVSTTSNEELVWQRMEGESREFTIVSEGTEFGDDGPVCLAIFSSPFTDDAIGSWEISLSQNENDLENDEQEEGINQKNQRITELESQLEQKNQTISELESRIEELESQSSDGSDGDVTIDVTVNPANGQNFVEGGEAVVQAESETADVSKMQVEYGAGTYELGSSGEVAIPLVDTGTQEMTLAHGDTIKEVSINVQSQAEQNQPDTPTTDADTPGFGIVAAVIALLTGLFLLRRY